MSLSQLIGFILAQCVGLSIAMLSLQLYADFSPLLQGRQSLAESASYVVLSKPVNTVGSALKGVSGFAQTELDAIASEPWASDVGAFTACLYDVSAQISFAGQRIGTDMFFESVPDRMVDVDEACWGWNPGDSIIPIVIPRDYLDLYNFGFAGSQDLPQVTEGLIGAMLLDVRLVGGGYYDWYKGRVAGLSDRINTILVPDAFMRWANDRYAPGVSAPIQRVIVRTEDISDPAIAEYASRHHYVLSSADAAAGRALTILRLATSVVTLVGLIICLLAVYILVLSIYLLLEKNREKIRTLLYLGCTRARVARPYEAFAAMGGMLAFAVATCLMIMAHHSYVAHLQDLLPMLGESGVGLAIALGFAIMASVTAIACVLIRRRV